MCNIEVSDVQALIYTYNFSSVCAEVRQDTCISYNIMMIMICFDLKACVVLYYDLKLVNYDPKY